MAIKNEQMPDVTWLSRLTRTDDSGIWGVEKKQGDTEYLKRSHVEATTVPKAEHEKVLKSIHGPEGYRDQISGLGGYEGRHNADLSEISRLSSKLEATLAENQNLTQWMLDMTDENEALKASSVPRDKVKALIAVVERQRVGIFDVGEVRRALEAVKQAMC